MSSSVNREGFLHAENRFLSPYSSELAYNGLSLMSTAPCFQLFTGLYPTSKPDGA